MDKRYRSTLIRNTFLQLCFITGVCLFNNCTDNKSPTQPGDSEKGTFTNGFFTNSKYGLSFNYDTSAFWLCTPNDSQFVAGSTHGADLGYMFYRDPNPGANSMGLISITAMWSFSTNLSGTDLDEANQAGLHNSTIISSDTTKFNGYPTARTYYSYTAKAGDMKGCLATFFFGGAIFCFDCDCNPNGFDAFNLTLTKIWNTIELSSGTFR
jgi:hypothetical protein